MTENNDACIFSDALSMLNIMILSYATSIIQTRLTPLTLKSCNYSL